MKFARFTTPVAVLVLALIYSPTASIATPTANTGPNLSATIVSRQGPLLTCQRKISILTARAEKAQKEYMKAVAAELDLFALVDILKSRENAAKLTVKLENITAKRLDDERAEKEDRIDRLADELELNEEKTEAFREVFSFNTKTLTEVSKKRDAAKAVADEATKQETIAEVRLSEATEDLDRPPFVSGELGKVVKAQMVLREASEKSSKAAAELQEFEEQVMTLKGEVTSAETKVQLFTQNAIELEEKLISVDEALDGTYEKIKKQEKVIAKAQESLTAVLDDRAEADEKLAAAGRKEQALQNKAEQAQAALEKETKDCKN